MLSAGRASGRTIFTSVDRLEQPSIHAASSTSRGSDTNYTVQLGLATYQGAHRTEWSAVMAGNVLVTLPIVLAFLFAQRTFIRSLTSTAVKG